MTFCPTGRWRPRLIGRSPAQRGFVLPLAIGTSLVLLLGSASVQTLAFHARLRARHAWHLQERRDRLRSAAMAFMEQASDPAQGCLLASAKQLWEQLHQACPDAEPAALQQGVVQSSQWRLLDWQPTPLGAEFTLALAPDAVAGRLVLRRREERLVLQNSLQMLPATGAPGPGQEGQP